MPDQREAVPHCAFPTPKVVQRQELYSPLPAVCLTANVEHPLMSTGLTGVRQSVNPVGTNNLQAAEQHALSNPPCRLALAQVCLGCAPWVQVHKKAQCKKLRTKLPSAPEPQAQRALGSTKKHNSALPQRYRFQVFTPTLHINSPQQGPPWKQLSNPAHSVAHRLSVSHGATVALRGDSLRAVQDAPQNPGWQ